MKQDDNVTNYQLTYYYTLNTILSAPSINKTWI
jgi:hypothetical protein